MTIIGRARLPPFTSAALRRGLLVADARDGELAPDCDIGEPGQGRCHGREKNLVVYAAAYETVDAALAGLDAIEQLHKDEMIGQYDAAVIDQENGKPHALKQRRDPPRKELHEAAGQLTSSQPGLKILTTSE